jgi:hypothetical protein
VGIARVTSTAWNAFSLMIRQVRLLLITSALLAPLAAGCGNVPFVTTGSPGSGAGAAPEDAAPYAPYEPDAGDAAFGAANFEVSEGAPATATAAQGSPLCNASPYVGGCYPDLPTTAKACGVAPDAGVEGLVVVSYDQALGCHVRAVGTDGGAAGAAGPDADAGNAVGPVCLAAGPGGTGAPCAHATDCAATYECVGSLSGLGTCHHYCCAGTSACSSDQFCDIQPLTEDSTTMVPVCMPTAPCVLLQACPALGPCQCAPDEDCQVVRENGTTSCVSVGAAGEGESCDSEHCAQGLTCIGATGARRCYTLCHTATAAECAPGESCTTGLPLFPDPTVGWCHAPQ